MKQRRLRLKHAAIEIFWELLCLVALACIAVAVVVDRWRNRDG